MFRLLNLAFIFATYFFSTSQAQDDDQIQRILNTTDVVASVQPSSANLGDWEPSEEMYQDLPYFQVGHDLKGRPVIVIELGRWKLGKYHEGSEESGKNAIKYVELLCNRLKPDSTAFKATKGVYMIFDYDGWTLGEFAIPGVPQNYIQLGSQLNQLFDPATMGIVSINVNAPAGQFLNFLKPVIGNLVAASELIGADTNKIALALLKDIPRDQMLERYGGTMSVKPTQFFKHE